MSRALATNVVEGVESILAWLASFGLGADLPSYCHLESAIGLDEDDPRTIAARAKNPEGVKPYILLTRECSMLTAFELTGSMDVVGEAEFETITSKVHDALASYFQRPGHSIEITFERDPALMRAHVDKMMEPAYATARRLGLDGLCDVLDDRCARVAALCQHESCLLLVYTHLSSMSSDELKREMADHRQRIKDHSLPAAKYAQSPTALIKGLLHTHETIIEAIEEDLRSAKMHIGRLSTHHALREIRRSFDRRNTSLDWKAALPGDRYTPRASSRKNDASNLLLPKLSQQLCKSKVDTDGEFVVINGQYHGYCFMELGPQDPRDFMTLFRRMGDQLPWRVKWTIEPGGIDSMAMKKTIVDITAFLSSTNAAIKRSFDALQEAREDGEHDITVKICASTWANSKADCQRQVSSIAKALEGWGITQVTTDAGDSIQGLVSTLPGFSEKNIAPRMVALLSDVVRMLPWQRPASPWFEGGSIPLRSLDGKLYPYQPTSSKQTAWIDLIWAIMGSGKSVWLNTLNLGSILSPGLKRIPLITIIDVGPSSAGLIDLLQSALPEDRKHEAIYVRLRNTDEFAINPFDTQLGCRYPTQFEREFQIAIISMLATPAGHTDPPESAPELAAMMIDEAYKLYASPGSMKRYDAMTDEAVDQAVAEIHFATDDKTTWWEVTDALMAAGRPREARLAQRFAVPVLSDLIDVVRSAPIRSIFSPSEDSQARTASGLTLIDKMSQVLTTALRDFRIISSHSRFEINENSRVVALDLDEVARGGGEDGERRAGIMFVFARQIAARQYYLSEEILKLCPPLYQRYHQERIEEIRDQMKGLCVDELHRTGGKKAFRKLLSLDRREGRKWGIRVSLASQFMADFNTDGESITESAFSVYIMNAGTSDTQKAAQDLFGLSDSAIDRLKRDVHGPGKFLVWHQVKSGVVTQVLHNAPGAIELWAFSTTPKDTGLRRRLYRHMKPATARKILAKAFPAGTAEAYMEQRQKELTESESDGVIDIVASELMAKYQADIQAERMEA